MARSSKWSKDDRGKLLKMVREGNSEQDIRDKFSYSDKKGNSRPMTAAEFAQQLKQAMVEAGEIKQATRQKKSDKKTIYRVTATGRLTISDFQDLTGAKEDEAYVLERPRGRSNAWRLVPVSGIEEEV